MKIEFKKIVYSFVFPATLVVVLWLVFLLERGLGEHWYNLGIFPRSRDGLCGIITEPLIHADFKHLFSNTAPLLILGWCLFYFYKGLSYAVFPILWLLSGLFTWMLGRESWHIGASGLIYSLSFFLFFSGIFRKHIPLLAISLLIAFLYGSTVWNMTPIAEYVDASVSWEGHLSGGIAGLLCAVIFKRFGPQAPEEEDDEEENDENENTQIIN